MFKKSITKLSKIIEIYKKTKIILDKLGIIIPKTEIDNNLKDILNVKTFTKRAKAVEGGYMGSFIKLNVDGKTVGNPSLRKYYKGMI